MDARPILRPLLISWLVLIGASWSPIPATDASEIDTTSYHLTRLGQFKASGLNNLGQVIGSGPTANNAGLGNFAAIYHGYGERAGTVEAILGPESAGTSGSALNERGQAVIEKRNSYIDPTEPRTLFWDGVEVRDIRPQVQQNHSDRFRGTAINNAGTIAGYFFPDQAGGSQLGLWSDGQLRPAADSPQFRYGTPSAINDQGQVVGSANSIGTWLKNRAVLWENGEVIDLGTFGGDYASALDINNAGQVVGKAQDADGNDHAFLWQDGTMTALGQPGLRGIYANSINSAGEILGVGLDDEGEKVPFLYSDGSFHLLNELLPPEFDLKHVDYRDINDLGQILGFGTNEIRITESFLRRSTESFLLTPGSMDAPAPIGPIPTVTPEPTTVVTVGVLGLVLIVHRKRARPSAR